MPRNEINPMIPLVAGWSLTRQCNLRCLHCYNAAGMREKSEMTTQEAMQTVDKFKAAGVQAVNFGGGECALRPDFIQICEYLHKNDIKISYTTNGTTYGIIKPHLELFNDIGVSIDFADEARHDGFRGVEGVYRKAISTIKDLVKDGVDTEIVTCLTKLNAPIEELEKLYSLSKELEVNYWRLNRFRANGRGIEKADVLALSQDDLKSAFSFLADKIPSSSSIPEPLFRSAFGGRYAIPGDPSGNTAFRIQHDGEVTPSVFLSISGGNIKDKSLEEIFGSPIFKAIRNRTPQGKCVQCPSYDHCRGGDAGASYLAYGHFNGPDPLCWLKPDDARPSAVHNIPKEWNVHEMYLCTLYVPMKNEQKNDARCFA